ncbi:MAG TPA: helix-turn-helix transcriptional regulator [Candidatus Pullilachnospira intestinigallinarum]|nr:helix-turn-helix transcriptional regulator [Candidatus Pullilachnospira intestinigallinarum]
MFNYSPLWDTMKRKKITQYRLIQDGILDNKTLDRLKKNENITVVTLERICRALDCDISQVVKLEPDEEEGPV